MAPGLRCTVCTHPATAAIYRAVLSRSVRDIAKQWGLTSPSVQRHKGQCVKKTVERAARASNLAEAKLGAGTLETVEGCVRRALELLTVAEVGDDSGKLTRATDIKGAVSALSAAAKHLGLQAQLRGEIKTGSTTNVLVDQRSGKPTEEWAELTTVLFAALRPWPDAARAAAAALMSVASSDAPRLGSAVPGRGSPAWAPGDVAEGEIEEKSSVR